MARLRKEIKVTVKLNDEDVVLVLREPSNQELNEFLAKRYEIKRNKLKDNCLSARVELFDLLLTGVQNLEDADGVPITSDRKDMIPATWKNDIIFKHCEDNEIDIKN